MGEAALELGHYGLAAEGGQMLKAQDTVNKARPFSEASGFLSARLGGGGGANGADSAGGHREDDEDGRQIVLSSFDTKACDTSEPPLPILPADPLYFGGF